MIKIMMPEKIASRLKHELQGAGNKEIGGILMGEHVSENVFRILDFTVQRYGGTLAYFIRLFSSSVKQTLEYFFHSTNHQYKKYNYLGEWHSHPSFPLSPSFQDRESMWEIVNDNDVGANFAILLIIKLELGELRAIANVFVPESQLIDAVLIRENVNYG